MTTAGLQEAQPLPCCPGQPGASGPGRPSSSEKGLGENNHDNFAGCPAVCVLQGCHLISCEVSISGQQVHGWCSADLPMVESTFEPQPQATFSQPFQVRDKSGGHFSFIKTFPADGSPRGICPYDGDGQWVNEGLQSWALSYSGEELVSSYPFHRWNN